MRKYVFPTLIFAAGYGEFRPVAENLTPEGRALNRTVTVTLEYEQD